MEDDVLSDDAKAVAGGWFGFMRPGAGRVTCHMRETKPTARAQAAIDELVAAGIVKVSKFNRYGGLVYEPLKDCTEYRRWLAKHPESGKFDMMEPVP